MKRKKIKFYDNFLLQDKIFLLRKQRVAATCYYVVFIAKNLHLQQKRVADAAIFFRYPYIITILATIANFPMSIEIFEIENIV